MAPHRYVCEIDTRQRKSGRRYRMRRCPGCGARRSTVEYWVEEWERLEDRSKALEGLEGAFMAASNRREGG